MPLFDDTSRTFTLDDPSQDVTVLIRDLGPSHLCELYNFQAWVENLGGGPFDAYVRFWVEDELTHDPIFIFESVPVTLQAGVPRAISFQNYVFSPYDYFYISIITENWAEPKVQFSMACCTLTTPNDPLLMQEQGWLLNDDSSYNVGYLNRVFKDALLRRNVYDEPMVVDPVTHIATLLRVSDQVVVHTSVFKDGVLLTNGSDWNFVSDTDIHIESGAYDSTASYTASYYTKAPGFRFSDAKLDLAKNILPVHSPIEEKQGYYCDCILDGSSRYYGTKGNVVEVTEADAWGASAPDVLEVTVAFVLLYYGYFIYCAIAGYAPISPQTYIKGEFFTFDFGTDLDGARVVVYGGIDPAEEIVP